MVGWTPDERHLKTFGPYEMVPERNGTETSHVVTLQDGQKIRVLPDADSSGQKRSRVIVGALKTLEALPRDFDSETFLIGALARNDLEWEWVQEFDTSPSPLIGALQKALIEVTGRDWTMVYPWAEGVLKHLRAQGFEIVESS